ncbi:putative MFS transporter [Meredithblackwellia eburnea MCA 4105]
MSVTPPFDTADIVDQKDSKDVFFDDNVNHAAPLPPVLAGMSEEELHAMRNRLVRRIDLRLLPMIVLMYIANYIDRGNIASARLGGLQKELGLNSIQYQTCISILFVGYLLLQVPSNVLLSHIGKPSIYLPSTMIVWGVISAATAGVKSYGGLIACRFVLGVVEAAFYPGAFSGLIAAGVVAHMNGLHGLRAWRWLYIIEGTVTVGIALCAIPIIPDVPAKTKWLSDEERAFALWRLECDAGAADDVEDANASPWKTLFSGMGSALRDPKAIMLALLVTLNVSIGTVSNFFPTLVGTLGYSSVKTLLLTAPPYCLATLFCWLNAYYSDKSGNRYWHYVAPTCVAIVGLVIAASTTKTAPRYFAMCIMPCGFFPSYIIAISWISSSIPRPLNKRAGAIAFCTVLSVIPQIYGSYWWPSASSPRYIMGFSCSASFAFASLLLATFYRFYLESLNKKLDAEREKGKATRIIAGILPAQIDAGFRFVI